MIRQLEAGEHIDKSKLIESCSGRRILAYFKAYGADYDFCRFFKAENDGEVTYIVIINSTMIICGKATDSEELSCFVQMHMPFRVEGTQEALEKVRCSGYQRLSRTTFRLAADNESLAADEKDICFSPKLDDVYAILKEGFPNLLDYGLWLTDTSHRVRHGISRVLTYKESTCATLVYDINDYVLVGQVATKPEARGSGYARAFLRWLAGYLHKQGKKAYLFALDIRESFYVEIGFEPVSREFVLERTDGSKDNILKGKLQ